MKKRIGYSVLLLYMLLQSCNGQSLDKQTGIVGGGCDGCELMYIGMPKEIGSMGISPGWNEKGQKLVLSGTVFQLDGKTPAPGVIIYYWQTDDEGYYSPKPGMDPRTLKHGHIRGWVKTDRNGRYTIKTIRPAPYPKDVLPAHIHLSIQEPDITNAYYTDEINFADDKLLEPHFKKYPQEKRGGNGVLKTTLQNKMQIAQHDIILGLNIPNYPKKR